MNSRESQRNGKTKKSEKIQENSIESGQIQKNMREIEKIPVYSKESESIPESPGGFPKIRYNRIESKWI